MKIFDYSSFPILSTERLTLRELRLSVVPDVFTFRGDPEVQKYNGPVFQNEEQVKSLIDELTAEYTAQSGLTWAETCVNRGKVLGLFGLHDWNKYHRRAEIGYDLARDFWGQGIGAETVHSIVRFGFEQMNLNRIYANTIADNRRSVHLLEKIGFRREGTRRQHSWEEDGTFHNSALFGLLWHEYKR